MAASSSSDSLFRSSSEAGVDEDGHHSFELHLMSAARFSSPLWKMPWDTSLCSQDIFPKPASARGAIPPIRVQKRLSEEIEMSSGATKRSSMMADAKGFFARQKFESWNDMANEERNLAVTTWLRIVNSQPIAFQICRDMYEARIMGLGGKSLADNISDVFVMKATATLHSRANPLIRFMVWASNKGVQAFPILEAVVHSYFAEFEASAAPTMFRSFLGSVAFAKFTVGLHGADLALQSGRVRGISSKLFLRKRKLMQRVPLRVRDLVFLEEAACGKHGVKGKDRVAAGFFVYLCLGRLRFSDGMQSGDIDIPSESWAYVTARVTRTKSSLTLERKTRLLHVCAPCMGVSGMNWSAGWDEAMMFEGLPRGNDKPLLPAPREKRCSCEWACKWLRSLLMKGDGSFDFGSFDTHSCKRTVLTWLSVMGVDRPTRSLLGYHVNPAAGISTELIYEALENCCRTILEASSTRRTLSIR